MKSAIIETGGKQYRIVPGEEIKIEKLPGTHKEGEKITFDKVLLIEDAKGVKIGTPYVTGVSVAAEFVDEGRSKKVRVLKFKRKVRYKRVHGHRQPYTKVKIKK